MSKQPFLYLISFIFAIPLIDSKYRTDPADRSIAGASLGGLFSLFVLFEHPGKNYLRFWRVGIMRD